MNIMIFDTETTSLEKPFCYNIGYVIVDDESEMIVNSKEFVVEQVWHNKMCFASAYYADKRPIYVDRMRKHDIVMDKFGYITQQMIRDIKNFDVKMAFAYNSDFDERVFNFNCDWFKCNNPFDTIPVKDIRAFAHKYIVDDEFKAFCEEHNLFTDKGNYSSTADTMGKYLYSLDFEEEHTALNDSILEANILLECIKRGADLEEKLTARKSIPKKEEKTFIVKKDGEVVFNTDYISSTWSPSRNTMYLRSK